MCGIVFGQFKNGRRASKSIMKRYRKQATRGKEGFGFVSITHDGRLNDVYRATTENDIDQKIRQDQSPTILFHHRRPTSTPNIMECAHPITVSNDKLNYDYQIVHNGVISNATFLRSEFEKDGFNYSTVVTTMYRVKSTGEEHIENEKFNDSESFAIDLARNIESGANKIISNGSIAFVAIQYEKDTKEVTGIYFGRNTSNPLKLDDSNDMFVLASEGSGKDVEINKLFCYDIKTKSITSEPLTLGTSYVTPTTPRNYSNPLNKPLLPAPKIPMDIVKDKEKEQIINALPSAMRPETIKIQKSTYSSVDLKSKNRTIYFKTCGDKVYKTNIDIYQLSHVTDEQWIEYDRLTKDIDSFILMRNSRDTVGYFLTNTEVDQINNELKKLHMRLRCLSDEINNTIRLAIQNKF